MKKKVAVLYGGKSGEHEVSLRSAASVIRNLDPEKFEVIPIGIDKEGAWHRRSFTEVKHYLESALPKLVNSPLLPIFPHLAKEKSISTSMHEPVSISDIDVVFPVMHGPHCEDGTIQGLLELSNIPYVGSGVLGSAVGMDKEFSKKIAASEGIKIVPYVTVRKNDWKNNSTKVRAEIEKLNYPVFVKPANLGSSVGVHKVKSAKDLEFAINDAFQFDLKLLVEKAINAREIEVAVLESTSAPIVSVPGEICATGSHEFYSYEAKYLDEHGAELHIPAKLSANEIKFAQEMAGKIFQALELGGMARVDLFLDKDSGEFYFNEVNTIPGFTSISMYPKMMDASGIPYKELLTRLIDLAIARHGEKSKLKNDYK